MEEKRTLHLNLKKKWFDMILSGEKTEEYRDLKPYWERRLTCSYSNYESHETKSTIHKSLYPKMNNVFGFETITFSNGYAKDRPQFEIEFKGIEIKEGNPNWGAESNCKYFVLKLGDFISTT